MNKKLTAIILLMTVLIMSPVSLLAKDYQLAEYEISWTGSMPAMTHEGLLTLKSLEADISDDGRVESLIAVVDMTSIDSTDLKGDDRDTLIEHLKSDDFFNVKKYPEATFVLKEHKDDRLNGTITIRGVAKEISLPVSISGNPQTGWTLVGKFDFKRKDYGVDYQNSGFLGLFDAAKSKIIRNLIDVNVSLKLVP